MDELEYEPHLERWKQMFGAAAGTAANLEYIEHQARHEHALAVWDPLFNLSTKVTLELPDKLADGDAKIYLRHGVGRRLQDMFDSYRDMVTMAHDGRTAPLHMDEQKEFSRHLNSFYINLRGVLDNLAYCLARERQPALTTELRRADIDLFSARYRNSLAAFREIEADIKEHDDWNREVKSRRDPVAHRIPLYLPPAIVTPDQAKRINELLAVQTSKVQAGEYADADRLSARAWEIGKFFPAFLHHPNEAMVPIYPTIPNDAGHLIKISRVVCAALIRK